MNRVYMPPKNTQQFIHTCFKCNSTFTFEAEDILEESADAYCKKGYLLVCPNCNQKLVIAKDELVEFKPKRD